MIAGCGQSSVARTPSLGGVPVVPGARVVAHVRSCDRGANAYCAMQVVITAPRYRTSAALLAAEQNRLRALGWTDTVGDTPRERSADSPGNRLRLSYALGADDLQSWDLGSLKRRRAIAKALAAAMFARVPALSLMLQAGSS